MWSQYDEDISLNPFFKEIKENHGDILEKASNEGWVICVPCKGSLKTDEFSVQTILDHVLVFDSDGVCESLSKNKVVVNEQCLVYQKNSIFQSEVSVLFKETHYVKETLKFSVWCISQLLFNVKNTRRMSENNNLIVLQSLQDCIDFLYCDNFLEHIRTLCEEFWQQHENTLSKDELQTQKEHLGMLYSQCLQIYLKSDLLYTREHYVNNVKIAIETYMQYCLGPKLMFILNTKAFFFDGLFNKIVRNSLHVSMTDLNIPMQVQGKVLEVKNELSRINNFVTILDKLRVLQRIYDSFSVTSDDFIPILVFLLINSNIPNWKSNLVFIKSFQFSLYDDYNKTSFLVTSLEAAISYIRSSQFFNIKSGTSLDDEFLRQYRQLNLTRDLLQVSNLLDQQQNYCHPLCACSKCSDIVSQPGNIVNDQGQNLLIYATIDNNIDLLQYLLTQDFDVNFTDNEGKTALHHAAENGLQVIMMLLLNANINVNAQDNAKNTALHLASDRGWETCVKALIYASAFAEVNLQNGLGETALFNAVKWGFMDVCRILLEHGASVCVKNNRGVTAYKMANNCYILELFDTFSKGRSVEIRTETHQPLVKPSKEPCTSEIDLLLKAIEYNDMQLTYYYLGYNNPPSEDCTKQLCHPLCDCTKCSQPIEYVQNPIKHLHVNQTNIEGLTPLHLAAKYGRTEILRVLLDCGAHVNVTTKKTRQTPLHLAVMFQRTNAIKELLTCGDILVDPQDFKGNTPLFYGCTLNNKSTKIVELLLQNGADCLRKNVEDKTVLQVCEEQNLFKICRILRQHLGCRENVDEFSDYVIL